MNRKMMRRIIMGLLFVLIGFPPFIFGGIPLHILMGLILFLVSLEVSSLVDRKLHPLFIGFNFIIPFLIYLLDAKYTLSLLSIYIIVLMVVHFVKETFVLEQIAYPFLIIFLVSCAVGTIPILYTMETPFYIFFYLALTSFMCDTCAYFVGVWKGKTKMIPSISPNKTWEGAIGGFVGGCVLSFLFGVFVLKSFPWQFLLVSSICLPMVSEIGDLCFSAIKRHFHIKDYSSIFPGHGGMLDRIDSMIFVLLFFRVLLVVWGI